jgi:hypothetical protein
MVDTQDRAVFPKVDAVQPKWKNSLDIKNDPFSSNKKSGRRIILL